MSRLPRCVALLLAPALGACALSGVLPSFHATTALMTPLPPGAPQPARVPARRHFEHHKSITAEFDSATNQTRISVTTHPGAYFLWVQRPRLTFFYVYAGHAALSAPQAVVLVFRTQDPQYPAGNRLSLFCDGAEQPQEVLPQFELEPQAFTTNRYLTYELPLATFAAFLECRTAAVRVADIQVAFAPDQLEALRDFGSRMY